MESPMESLMESLMPDTLEEEDSLVALLDTSEEALEADLLVARL